MIDIRSEFAVYKEVATTIDPQQGLSYDLCWRNILEQKIYWSLIIFTTSADLVYH